MGPRVRAVPGWVSQDRHRDAHTIAQAQKKGKCLRAFPNRLVPQEGLEPPWANAHYALNVARLPIPPLRRTIWICSPHYSIRPGGCQIAPRFAYLWRFRRGQLHVARRRGRRGGRGLVGRHAARQDVPVGE